MQGPAQGGGRSDLPGTRLSTCHTPSKLTSVATLQKYVAVHTPLVESAKHNSCQYMKQVNSKVIIFLYNHIISIKYYTVVCSRKASFFTTKCHPIFGIKIPICTEHTVQYTVQGKDNCTSLQCYKITCWP